MTETSTLTNLPTMTTQKETWPSMLLNYELCGIVGPISSRASSLSLRRGHKSKVMPLSTLFMARLFLSTYSIISFVWVTHTSSSVFEYIWWVHFFILKYVTFLMYQCMYLSTFYEYVFVNLLSHIRTPFSYSSKFECTHILHLIQIFNHLDTGVIGHHMSLLT